MNKDIKSISYHSLYIDQSKCIGLTHCMRVCPTKSIRVRNGKARIINDRCIDCGECIKACSVKAIIPLTTSFTDLSKFKHIIAIPSPVLYGQFSQSILPLKIQKGLLELGFDEVVDISDSCEAVSLAIAEFLNEYKGPKPLITTVCPTVVRLVQSRYPELVDNLLPIENPREIIAKEVRAKKSVELGLEPEEIGLIYLTPCPSKMIAIKEPARNGGKSNLDGAISISDIYNPLLKAITKLSEDDEEKALQKMSSFGLSWAMLGGVARPLAPENWLGVSGLHDVMRIFSEIEESQIGDVELLECFSCIGGCIGGSLCVENMYVARSKVIKLSKKADKKRRWQSSKISRLYKEGYFTKKEKYLPRPAKPLDRDISKAIEKAKQKKTITKELPGIDCGVCGSPTCRSLAEDIVLGHAKITDCFAKREEQLREKANLKIVKDE